MREEKKNIRDGDITCPKPNLFVKNKKLLVFAFLQHIPPYPHLLL